MIHQSAWLLLVHQLPARPSNARVKTWRRLQKIGAMPVKNSIYVLPYSAQAREDFEWLKTEIEGLKGQATVLAADHIDASTGEEIMQAFQTARQKDYAVLRRQAAGQLDAARRARPALPREEVDRARRALETRCAEITAIDFFSAPGREEAVAVISALGRHGKPAAPRIAPQSRRLSVTAFRGRRWVTRPRPGVDRMSTAWLIRRFIDPSARFTFAAKPEDAPRATPFDMYGVEFSHHGSDCTFETFLRRFCLKSPALSWIARIVHQLDVKDDSVATVEAPAIGRIIHGLRLSHADDQKLLLEGIQMFEALYQSYEHGKKQR